MQMVRRRGKRRKRGSTHSAAMARRRRKQCTKDEVAILTILIVFLAVFVWLLVDNTACAHHIPFGIFLG